MIQKRGFDRAFVFYGLPKVILAILLHHAE
jgi:hypothetical protein